MESDRFTRHSYEDWMNETAADVERDLELETEMQDETARDAWRRWWNEEGSAERPLPNEDTEQFAKRITEIAWSNGAFKRLADVDLLRAELAAMQKQRDEQVDYSIALQRAIEHHRRGVAVPPAIAANCPHHAQMLNEHLAQKEGGGA